VLTTLRLLRSDLRHKARWCYDREDAAAVARALATDGTGAMVLYRLMQGARRHRLWPLEMIFNKLTSMFSGAIIGRGVEFGPGLVLVHATGVVINASVRGGADVVIEHQVTIGAERRASPLLGDDVFIGTGAKLIGDVRIGDGARIGANAVVVDDVPAHTTVVGIPARPVRRRDAGPTPSGDDAPAPPGPDDARGRGA
jgi:serine O-acetyltransferase